MESYVNLGNPRPSSGYNAVLGNIPASAPPSVGSLASMTPSVSNNVKEVMTNAVATYPVFAKPYKMHYEQYLHPGDLIFVYVHDTAATAGVERRGKPCVVANLPLLNHFLSLATEKAYTAEGIPKGFTNANHWEWLGVMRNDMQVSGGAPGVGRICRKPQYQRLLNVDVRGATRTFNYWANAKSGDTLFLKKVKLNRRTLATGDIENAMKSIKTDKDELVTQLVPTVMKPNLYDVVDSDFKNNSVFNTAKGMGLDQEALTTDERDDEANAGIKIGYCFQHIGTGERVYDRAAVLAALNFQDDRFKLPVIPMFIRT